MAVPNDFIRYIFNIFTGQPIPAIKFNPDRLVTSDLNSAGQPRVIWNPESSSYIPDGPTVVIDNEGNVVFRGT